MSGIEKMVAAKIAAVLPKIVKDVVHGHATGHHKVAEHIKHAADRIEAEEKRIAAEAAGLGTKTHSGHGHGGHRGDAGGHGVRSPGKQITEKELPDLARKRATENIDEAQKTGARPPTATSSAVDRATGRVYYGKSGSIPDPIHPDLASRMPDPSREPWPPGNCAEFHAVNEAMLNGAELKDISYATVRTRSGVSYPSCANCQVALSGAMERL